MTDGRIRAWSLAGDVAYRFAGIRLAPLARLQFGITSGDDDPLDDTLGTFRAPFPPGRFFGHGNPLGPGNLVGLRPVLQATPSPDLTVSIEAGAFWRLRTTDGVYAPPQVPVRGPEGDAHFVGSEVALTATYALTPNVALYTRAARFTVGDYIRDNPPARDLTYLETGMSWKF